MSGGDPRFERKTVCGAAAAAGRGAARRAGEAARAAAWCAILAAPLSLAGVPCAGAAAYELPVLGTFEGNQQNAHLGYSAACAGDVNGDGFSDLVLGVRDYTGGQANEGRVVVHYGSPSGYAPLPDWTFESNQALAFLGAAVASAGDANGDGFHDLLVAAPSFDDGESNEGVVHLFLGGAAGLAATPAWSRGGDQATAAFGSSVAFAGDVNGDGFDDVVIGARGADGAFANEGRASLFLGSAEGLASLAAWTATGGQTDPGFGWSVAGAGDVNGDGFADVLVGAFFHDAGETDEGAAFLHLGGAGGLASSPVWTGQGDQVNAGYGWSLAGAGDVSGDGYADVVVGARFFDAGFSNEGKAFVYFGGASGLGAAAAWTTTGGEANAYLGWCVASAGDVNGDGLADVLLGAPRADAGAADAGRVRLVLGRRDGAPLLPVWSADGGQTGAQLGWWAASAGDANGDGFGDVALCAPYADAGQTDEGIVTVRRGVALVPERAPSSRLNGGPTSAAFGRALAFLGDVNGDGYSDLAAGDPYHSNGQLSEGRVDVYYGAPSGYDTTPDWSAESDQAGAFFGWAVARAGDVNGDGYDDLLAGAPNWDGAFENEGRAALYFGSAAGLAPAPGWVRVGGQPGANFGAALAGGGDADGDGFADIAVGAPLHDGGAADVGAVQWFRGAASGPSALAQRLLLGSATGDEFGAALAHAGDVHGDGFSDVLVGAPGFSNGFTSEGAAFLFRGTASGLAPLASWTRYGGEAEARFGGCVAFAGDVNGDGASDALASGRGFDGGSFDEGRAELFLGGAGGLAPAPAWSFEGGEAGAELDAIASAGDVDADGYSDVAAGASSASAPIALEGAAHCFRGGPGGLGASPAWSLAGGVSFARLGSAFAGPGDANGDGFADLAIGAPGQSDSAGTGGAVLVARGNGGPGAPRPIRQLRSFAPTPIAAGGASDAGNGFRAVILATMPAGRGRVRAEIESKLAGSAFDGSGLVVGPWVETELPSAPFGSAASLEETLLGYFAGARIHWRARVRSPSPIFPASPWFTLSDNSAAELDLRTNAAGPTSAPPSIAPPAASSVLGLAIESCSPHPVRGAATLLVRTAADRIVELALFDVAGRRVRTLARAALSAGLHRVPLVARDESQRPLAAGVYFVRAESAGESPAPESAARRIVVVR